LSGARWWRRFNTFLVALAAVLAALSGAAGLSEAVNHKVLAVLALLAAAISAVSAALGAAGRASTALNAATADTMLADSARRFYLTIAPHMAIEEVRAQFDRLCEQRNRVVAASPGDVMPWTHRRYAFFKGHIERSMGRARSEYEAASKDASSDADSAASTSIDQSANNQSALGQADDQLLAFGVLGRSTTPWPPGPRCRNPTEKFSVPPLATSSWCAVHQRASTRSRGPGALSR